MLAKIHNNTLLQEQFFTKPYRVHTLLFSIFILQGFFYATPAEIAAGFFAILTTPDVLVTDYIAVGGLGAALVSVGLTGLTAVAAFKLAKHQPTGLTMGALGLTVGFAFFGKNPMNVIPIYFGGYLYSRFAKKPFSESCMAAILGACLAPAVTQLAFSPVLHTWAGAAIGILIGIAIGFLINPLAAAVKVTHEGYNLYNVGFAAGIFGVAIFAVLRHLGLDHETANIWSSGYNRELTLFLAITSVFYILCGILCKTTPLWLMKKPGSTREYVQPHPFKSYAAWLLTLEAEGNDFFKRYAGKAYIAMGVMGLGSLLFMFVVQGEYSGPVLGAILSVVGFGAFGKALHSATPIVTGAMLAAVVNMLLTGTAFNTSDFLVAAIFSTCLSPLCKRFGVKWGLAAGFLHLTLAVNIAGFHGGLNLYNNGFAGGLAAMALLPFIKFFEGRGQGGH